MARDQSVPCLELGLVYCLSIAEWTEEVHACIQTHQLSFRVQALLCMYDLGGGSWSFFPQTVMVRE